MPHGMEELQPEEVAEAEEHGPLAAALACIEAQELYTFMSSCLTLLPHFTASWFTMSLGPFSSPLHLFGAPPFKRSACEAQAAQEAEMEKLSKQLAGVSGPTWETLPEDANVADVIPLMAEVAAPTAEEAPKLAAPASFDVKSKDATSAIIHTPPLSSYLVCASPFTPCLLGRGFLA
jgi:hypothetical protein